MAHSQNLVVSLRSLKTNKFYHERDNKVFVPFGDEYTVYVKNLDTRRAVVTITLDGENPRDCQFVIDGNSAMELKSDKMERAFKFIKKTEKISNFRGDKIDDSLVRVEWQFEKSFLSYFPPSITTYAGGGCGTSGNPVWKNLISHTISGGVGSVGGNVQNYSANVVQCSSSNSIGSAASYSMTRGFADAVVEEFVAPDEGKGLTVQGREEKQNFSTAYVGALDPGKYVITLQLTGETRVKPVTQAMHSRSKQQCKICGTQNKAGSNYCRECGAALL